MSSFLVDVIEALGGLAGLAALLAVFPQLSGIKKNTAKTLTQFQPNHGSSLKDAVNRIEKAQLDFQKSVGHQIGEIRTDIHDIRTDVQTLQMKEILK